ncbi:CTD kinase subunit beta [[Candida] jaroonii]|uniref:CTD kinase subunit beta n=1 Tax=[Candida] jaroonii TaxID=467808 RepID=A0ACA9YCG7_9ASCO|nr:CTD kinase subunit beta [[Candida] jaroonii]
MEKTSSLSISRPYYSPKELSYLHSKTIADSKKVIYNQRKHQVYQYLFQIIKVLKLPLKVLNTSMIYYQKFYLFNIFEEEFEDFSNIEKSMELDPFNVSLASLFLACKNEDCIKKLRDILLVANKIKDNQIEENFIELQRKIILGLEFKLLQILQFNFNNQISFSTDSLVLQFCKKINLNYKYSLFCWLVNFDLMLTPIGLTLPPHCIALAIIIISLNFKPNDLKTRELSSGVNENILDSLNPKDFKCPEKLVNEGILYILDFYIHQYNLSILNNYLPQINEDLNKEQIFKFMNLKSKFNNLRTLNEHSIDGNLLKQDESLSLFDYSISSKGTSRFINKRKRLLEEID